MVTRVDGWQDSKGKIWPTEEDAQKSQTAIDREAALFSWAYHRGLSERAHISVDTLLFHINQDWDNFLRLAITGTR